MLKQSGGAGPWIVESDQQTDTFISTPIDGYVGMRLCSVRSQEAQLGAIPNQNYARVVFAAQGSALSFCVCDGLDDSYLGYFAARYLATRLTDFLLALPGVPRDPRKTAIGLRKQLKIWAVEAQIELDSLGFPLSLPETDRQILADKNQQYGSATVFFCGRIDYGVTTRTPQAIPALLCWMGHVTARVFASPGSCQLLGDGDSEGNCWSTLLGQQGILTIRVSSLSRGEPLIIHTGGLDALGHQLAQLDDQQLPMRIRQILHMPIHENMTVLDLRWGDVGRT